MKGFKQTGLSLVELMLAMAVGLLLMTFVVQAFVANKATNRFNEGLSEIQESGRYGINLLRNEIRMSAYRLDPTNPPLVNPLLGVDNNGPNNSDSLTIRYQGRPAIGAVAADVDCTGGVPALGIIVNTFNLQSDANNNNRLALFCNDGGGNNVAILPGVEDLQFEYGVDLTNDGAANAYLTAGEVVNMNQVVSIRVAMLLATEDNVGSSTEGRNYRLLDPNQLAGPFNDQRLRRVFSLTVVIRNSNDDN